MVELKLGLRTVDLPYSVRLFDVTEEMFDELVNEDMKAELFDGVMIVHSPASPRHGKVSGFIRTLAGYFTEDKELGDVFGPDALIHLATCRKFAPDFFYLERDRVPCPLPAKQFEGIPDWVGEVLSPTTRDDDLEDKRPAYQAAGAKEIWIVDLANEEVLVDRKRGRKYVASVVKSGRLESTVIPGFWIDVAWLWKDPLPRAPACLRKILK